jgi:hypothetical protein
MDDGANICITGDLSILLGIVDIPPMPITVATSGDVSLEDCCTKCSYLPLTLLDGTIYWHLCYYCANVVETIISPQAVLATSDVFTLWTQTGYCNGHLGCIRFNSVDGCLTMKLTLEYQDGLYYCPSNIFTVAPSAPNTAMHIPAHNLTNPPDPTIHCIATRNPASVLLKPTRYTPMSKGKQLESKLWLLQLGSPGVHQLDSLPGNATGIPSVFEHHPFCFINFKAQARIPKQAAQRLAVRTTEWK